MTLPPLLSRPRTPRPGSLLDVNGNLLPEMASRLQIRIIGIPARIRAWSFFGLDRMSGLERHMTLAP
ncbi:hypothetical protein MMC22_010998, partial [Lobaria immixta]|nr:hypothetical protein [Lobaria immixta]